MPHAAGGPVTIQDILRRVAAAMLRSTSSENVCGLMEMRVAPYSLMMRSFFFVGAVRAARFHGKLFQGGQVKLLGHGAHQLAQLLRVDAGGGCRRRYTAF